MSCDTAGYARVWDCRAWGSARHVVTPATTAGATAPLFGCAFWPAIGQASSSSSAGGGEFLVWSSSGLLAGFDVTDGRLLGNWMCSGSADGAGAPHAQQYPVFDVAISDCGTYVCAVGGPSDRQRQQARKTSSVVNTQNAWGVPAQLWHAIDSSDGMVRANVSANCLLQSRGWKPSG